MSDIYCGALFSSNYLEHHGIKGMKWGVRRFQNKDGSLTSVGKSRLKTVRKDRKESEYDHAQKVNQTTERIYNAAYYNLKRNPEFKRTLKEYSNGKGVGSRLTTLIREAVNDHPLSSRNDTFYGESINYGDAVYDLLVEQFVLEAQGRSR